MCRRSCWPPVSCLMHSHRSDIRRSPVFVVHDFQGCCSVQGLWLAALPAAYFHASMCLVLMQLPFGTTTCSRAHTWGTEHAHKTCTRKDVPIGHKRVRARCGAGLRRCWAARVPVGLRGCAEHHTRLPGARARAVLPLQAGQHSLQQARARSSCCGVRATPSVCGGGAAWRGVAGRVRVCARVLGCDYEAFEGQSGRGREEVQLLLVPCRSEQGRVCDEGGKEDAGKGGCSEGSRAECVREGKGRRMQ